MTLPTLIKNHQRTVYVTQLRKVVNELSQAAEQAITDNNAISLDETKYTTNHTNGAKNFLNDYFKIVNDCGTNLTPCFASSYETLDGRTVTLQTPLTSVSLASGASISIFDNMLKYYSDGWHGELRIQIDINGAEGPNIAGRDLFYVKLYSDGKVGENYSGENTSTFASECGTTYNGPYNTYGLGCFAKIMNDGWKMDY